MVPPLQFGSALRSGEIRVTSLDVVGTIEVSETLEQAGELTRVADPVDTNLLITEWADREMKSPGGGKALLFEQPVIDGKISKFPVAINTMGSRKRIAMALGRESIEEIAQEIQLILKAKPPTDLREGWGLLK